MKVIHYSSPFTLFLRRGAQTATAPVAFKALGWERLPLRRDAPQKRLSFLGISATLVGIGRNGCLCCWLTWMTMSETNIYGPYVSPPQFRLVEGKHSAPALAAPSRRRVLRNAAALKSLCHHLSVLSPDFCPCSAWSRGFAGWDPLRNISEQRLGWCG